MRTARLIHLYLGVFFAPLILFFAITGTMQTFEWHETYRHFADGKPNAISWLAQIHKTGALTKPPPVRPPAPGAVEKAMPWPQAAAKFLIGLMGVALAVSTVLGLAIAWSLRARRPGVIASFVVGLVLPWLLFFLY